MTSRPTRQPVKALALFFAGLAAAKPVLLARQDAETTSSAPVATSSVPAEAASITPTPSMTVSLAADAVVAAAVVTPTLSGTQRTCSVDYVTAFTSTEFLTWTPADVGEVTTEPLYTLSIDPTIGCTCNDGWMAGIGTSMGTDGLQTVTCQFGDDENPAIATQTSEMVPSPTYVDEWCETIDTNDPDELIDMWENKNVSAVLDSWTRENPDDWLQRLVEYALKNEGDVGYGGCGVIGGSCNLGLDCKKMVSENGMGAEYWILKAVEGFHDKLHVAHEFLQDTTLDNILSLDEIAEDFSAPTDEGVNALDILAPLLSAGIFLGGSVTGVVGVAASEIAIAARAAKAAAEAAARAARNAGRNSGNAKFLGQAAAAAKAEDIAGGAVRTTNALGAGLWTTASTFTMIGAFTDPEGQVETSDLTPMLHTLFSSAQQQIEDLGGRALGRGGDYSALPTAQGSGFGPELADDSYIAGFFSDGKFLLSESNPTFNESIQNSYGTFKSRIVDQALQTAGYQVFALTNLDNEDECYDPDLWGGYGAQWMDPLGDGEMICMKLYRKSHGDGCGALTSCDWVAAEDEKFNTLQDKYGFNMVNYYAAAAQCNKAQLENNVPDFQTTMADGVMPACYYGIKAQKADKYKNCHGRDNLLCDSGFNFSDF